MDVTKMLGADHRYVEQLFDAIPKADGAERQPLIDDLTTSLQSHMELEERVVYPKIAPVAGEEPVQEADTEHDLARKALEDVVAPAPDEPGFGAALEALKGGITHHVEEEETEVFPTLRREGAEMLAEMATPFMTTRLELGMPMEADALSAASTKKELVTEADSAGVEGAHSMTKAELADALAAKMS